MWSRTPKLRARRRHDAESHPRIDPPTPVMASPTPACASARGGVATPHGSARPSPDGQRRQSDHRSTECPCAGSGRHRQRLRPDALHGSTQARATQPHHEYMLVLESKSISLGIYVRHEFLITFPLSSLVDDGNATGIDRLGVEQLRHHGTSVGCLGVAAAPASALDGETSTRSPRCPPARPGPVGALDWGQRAPTTSGLTDLKVLAAPFESRLVVARCSYGRTRTISNASFASSG